MARGLTRGFLGLGSNLGDRRANLQSAVTGLEAAGVGVLGSSSVYETAPVGLVLDQPAFLNACVEVETELTAFELLDLCKQVEAALGRDFSAVRHGPRPIDIDILLFGSETLESDRLVVPHPALCERRFVLVPLLELEPAAALPDGSALSEALTALGDDDGVVLAGSSLIFRPCPRSSSP
ncbi:MAG: 2-amino-4-hydroxy-6-hydroxymethyldihydropteridine diphosphokinase [Solirubrobacterales bacterium]|nr:2-amino-4-hydroxy-6-hydroxymethyldihydropteridine diphosphokinase [Solirubrobacterales bacterium]